MCIATLCNAGITLYVCCYIEQKYHHIYILKNFKQTGAFLFVRHTKLDDEINRNSKVRLHRNVTETLVHDSVTLGRTHAETMQKQCISQLLLCIDGGRNKKYILTHMHTHKKHRQQIFFSEAS